MFHEPRILFYVPDNNVRNLQRYLAIANRLRHDLPTVQQTLITENLLEDTTQLPPGVKVISLPTRVRTLHEGKKSLQAIKREREVLIQRVIFQFQPHLVLVDRIASGLNGEMVPILRFLKVWSPNTKIVYGMPDMEASPQSVEVSWQINGIYRLLDEVYDRILFYGQRDLFDPILAYRIPVSTAVKVVECGYLDYLGNVAPVAPLPKKQDNDVYSILIVIDSEETINNLEEMLVHGIPYQVNRIPVHLSVFFDTKITIQKIRDMLTALEEWPIDTVELSLASCRQHIDTADLVICNASYSAVCSIVARHKQTLFLISKQSPPDYLMRAQILSRAGLAYLCDLSYDMPDCLNWKLSQSHHTPLGSTSLHVNGVNLASQTIASMLVS